MAKQRYLSRRQLIVLDDLFNSDLDEQEVLDKHKVRRRTYERWAADELFMERFGQYVEGVRRRSEFLMAKYRLLAAAKLVELTTSERAETARKACLDIISLPKSESRQNRGADKADEKEAEQLPPEVASKLLAALAETKQEFSESA